MGRGGGEEFNPSFSMYPKALLTKRRGIDKSPTNIYDCDAVRAYAFYPSLHYGRTSKRLFNSESDLLPVEIVGREKDIKIDGRRVKRGRARETVPAEFHATRYSFRAFYGALGVLYIARVNYTRTYNRILHRSRIESRARISRGGIFVAARRFNILLC